MNDVDMHGIFMMHTQSLAPVRSKFTRYCSLFKHVYEKMVI
jgi:hypothetical protein